MQHCLDKSQLSFLHINRYTCLFSIGSPYSPTAAQSEVTTSTANISWTVPNVPNNTEDYTVTFHGLDIQTEPRQAQWTLGDSNYIPSAGFVYHIMLEDLEEASTYYYSVQPTVCVGSISNRTLQFTTLPDGELSNYINQCCPH